MIKLFVGLGNPGPDYEATRHNAGFWWIDALARELKATLVPERSYHGLVARTSVHGQSVWLLQPQTFMNLSGKSVASLARFFKIQPEEILVAHDELDIAPGQVKLKRGGQPCRAQRPAGYSCPARFARLLAPAHWHRASGRQGRSGQLGAEKTFTRPAHPDRGQHPAFTQGASGLAGGGHGESHVADPHHQATASQATKT